MAQQRALANRFQVSGIPSLVLRRVIIVTGPNLPCFPWMAGPVSHLSCRSASTLFPKQTSTSCYDLEKAITLPSRVQHTLRPKRGSHLRMRSPRQCWSPPRAKSHRILSGYYRTNQVGLLNVEDVEARLPPTAKAEHKLYGSERSVLR